MKCPECRFICSNLRDICPKCLLDLRQYKRSHSLPISFPKATYEELLGKLGKLPTTGKNSERKGWFSKLFFSSTPEQPASSNTEGAEAQIVASPIVLDTEDQKIDSEVCIVSSQEKNIPADISFSETEIDVAEATDLGIPQDDTEVSITHDQMIYCNATENKDEPEGEPGIFKEEVSGSVQTRIFDPVISPVIDGLFDEAFFELSNLKDEREIALGYEQLQRRVGGENVLLLFDMAANALRDPAYEERYKEELVQSEERNVESEGLVLKLAAIEHRLQENILSLKPKSERIHLLQERQKIAARNYKRKPATPVQQITSIFVDVLSILLLSFTAGVLLVYIQIPERELSLANLSTILSILSFGMVAFIFISIFYPIICILGFGKTIGDKISGITLRAEKGGSPYFSNILVRSLLFGPSLFLFGYLPVFYNRPSFYDYFARTRPTQA